ncbi:PA14 domain-containing protein, partial (plasmid) [Chromobacterium amazonense]|uniref:beta strand repeat-containing protein n=1 Tax=Chromobacterium amazonense TaxID=1382803 RepID=UPI00237DBB7B
LSDSNLSSGGSALITIKDGSANSTVTVHSDGSVTSSNPAVTASYAGGVLSLGIPEPANGQQVSVSATQTNVLGNVSAAGSDSGTLDVVPPDAPAISFQPNGLTALLYGLNDSHISNPASGQTALSTVLADLTNHSPTASFVATSLNFGDQNGVWHGSTDFGNNLGNSLANLNAFLGGNASNLQLTSAYGVTTQSILTLNGAFSAAAGNYTLNVNADDGFQIIVDGKVVSQFTGNQAQTEHDVALTLGATAGNLHAIQIVYWDQGGNAVLQVGLTPAGAPAGATPTPLTLSSNTLVGSVTLDSNDQQALSNHGSLTVTEGASQLQLSLNANGQLVDGGGTVYAYQNGVVYLPLSGNAATLAATVTDSVGNVSLNASASYAPPPVPTVTLIEHTAQGDQIGAGDLAGGKVQATVALDPVSLANNGFATLTIHDGGASSTVTVNSAGVVSSSSSAVSASYADGTVTLAIAAPANGQAVSISATQTDSLGHASSSGSASGTLNLTPPAAPIVTVAEHFDPNGWIGPTDLAHGQVQATVALDSNSLGNGGSAQVSINDGGVTSSVTVHSDGSVTSSNPAVTASYAGGVLSLGIPEPANGQTVSVSATQTNALGNVSAAGSDSGTLDVVPPDAPAISFQPNGLTALLYGLNDSHISNPASGQTALSTVLADLTNHSPTASFVATSLNFGDQNGVWHGSTDFGNNLGNSLANLNAFLGGNASNLQLTSAYGVTTQSILTLNGAFSAAAGNYTLNVNADDGFQIIVDGKVVSQFTGNQAQTEHDVALTLGATAGNLHAIQIVYWDQGGNAVLQVGLTPAGAPAGATPTPLTLSSNTLVGSVTLDSNDQQALSNHGSLTVTEGASQLQLSLNANGQLVDGSGTVYAYQNGVVYLPLGSASEAATVAATVTDGAGNVSLNASGSYTPLGMPQITLGEPGNNHQEQASVGLDANSLANHGYASIVVSEAGASTTLAVHSDGSITGSTASVTAAYAQGNVDLSIATPANAPDVTVTATATDGYGHSNTVSQMQVFAAHGSPVTAIAGVETFKFEASFNGHAGTPSVETIQQFNTGTTPSGAPADVLDLRDLLVGDSHNGADPSSIGNLANYLHFSTVNNNGTVSTVIHVNENGAINANSPTSDTAQIVLQGVDLTHSGSTLLSDQAIIQKLLGSGQLHTD